MIRSLQNRYYNTPLVHWTPWKWLRHTGTLKWKPSQGTKLYCLVNRGTLVWTTCPRLLPDNAAAAWESNSRPAHRKSSALTTTPPSHLVVSASLCVVHCLFIVLPHSTLPDFYIASLPSLVRFCRAFPPLCDDAIGLLLQLGRSVHAHLSTVNASSVGQTLYSSYLWHVSST